MEEVERLFNHGHGLTKQAAFKQAFPGFSFKRTTYNENGPHWLKLSMETRVTLVSHGRTPKGLWTAATKLAGRHGRGKAKQ